MSTLTIPMVNMDKIGKAETAPKIVTEHVFPPIPDRRFDWAAYDENYEPPDSDGVGGWPIGWGRTEAEAIADYQQQLEDAS